jgi:hypothetical protein
MQITDHQNYRPSKLPTIKITIKITENDEITNHQNYQNYHQNYTDHQNYQNYHQNYRP